MPGFGDSGAIRAGIEPTARNLAAEVLAFAGTLGLRSVPKVAGISLGAWVAIECGRLDGASGVVALCPAGFWKSPLPPRTGSAYEVARLARPFAPLLMRIRGLRTRALATNVHQPDKVPLSDAIALLRGYGGAEGYVESSRHMRASAIGDLSDLRVPLTIGWGEFDRLVRNRPLPPDGLPPGTRQVVLAGCGHIPTWDDPEQVARVILEGAGSPAAARE